MLIIICAMYCEAKGLIKHFCLKKKEYSAFDIYAASDDRVVLIISQTGRVNAAAAVGCVCGMYAGQYNINIVNFGIAAGRAEDIGKLFLVNKIVDSCQGKTFFPDMLFTTDIDERAVYTQENVVASVDEDANMVNGEAGILYDMEAAAIYQAGVHFAGPHQMSFLKLVSDSGVRSKKDGAHMAAEAVEGLIAPKMDEIIKYIDTVLLSVQKDKDKYSLSSENQMLFAKTVKDMHCSKSMERELMQQFRYHELSQNSLAEEINKMYDEGKLPCRDKRTGKVYFDELKRAVLQ